jgi:hypothetical protein
MRRRTVTAPARKAIKRNRGVTSAEKWFRGRGAQSNSSSPPNSIWPELLSARSQSDHPRSTATSAAARYSSRPSLCRGRGQLLSREDLNACRGGRSCAALNAHAPLLPPSRDPTHPPTSKAATNCCLCSHLINARTQLTTHTQIDAINARGDYYGRRYK